MFDLPLYVLGGVAAAFVQTVTILGDKTIVTPRLPDTVSLAVSGVAAFLLLAPLFVVTPPAPTPGWTILVFGILGAVNVAGGLFYFRAVRAGDPATLSIIWRLEPLFVLALATAFLGELFTLQTYAGLLLIFIAVFAVLLRRAEGGVSLSAGAVWAIAGAALYSVTSVILRYVFTLSGVDGWTGFLWLALGSALGFTLYFVYLFGTSTAFVSTVRSLPPSTLSLLVGRMVLIFLSSGLIVISISAGPVAIVSSLLALQTVFLVLATTALAKWSWSRARLHSTPSINQLTKLAASCAVIVGVYLIS